MDFAALLTEVVAGTAVRSHSEKVKPGDVFVALPPVLDVVRGAGVVDGAQFILTAVERGAAVVVAAHGTTLPAAVRAELLTVDDVRAALGELARAAYGALPRLIGVTGTNGKTTASYLIEHLFASAGQRMGALGTINYRWPGHVQDALLTTPDCLTLHALLSDMCAADVDMVVMEVSSHALHQQRIAGLEFDAAVLTNVTQDHLDYHHNMEAYFEAKAILFRDAPKADKAWVINYEDPYGQRLLAEGGERALGYGLGTPPEGVRVLKGEIKAMDATGLTLGVRWEDAEFTLVSPLVGRYNAMNLLAAMGTGFALGLNAEAMQALAEFGGVPGRLERVPNEANLNVFVDYAHTPDALVNVLSQVKALGVERLICVFGCGGDRDRTKRPLMGQAVCRYADLAILTSDNPRHEDPLDIIEDVRPGLSRCAEVRVEPDRRAAIALALAHAGPEDAVVIAGKGHESYQQVGDEKLPFSDVAVAKEIMT